MSTITLDALIALCTAAGQLAGLPAPVLAAIPALARALHPLLERVGQGEALPEIVRAVLPDDAALVRQTIEAELAKGGGS